MDPRLSARVFLASLAAAALLPLAAGAAELPFKNGDFEQAFVEGKGVPEWLTIVHAGPPSYLMSVVRDEPGSGKQSARIERTQENAFGSIKQTIDIPAEVVGKKVELSGLIKTKGVGDEGAVLSMTFMAGSRIITQHRTEPRKGDSAWAPVKLVTEVPAGTNRISIAAVLLDGGVVWFDNISLHTQTGTGASHTDTKEPARPAKPKTPTGRASRNDQH